MAGDRPGPDPVFSDSAQFTLRTERSHLDVFKARAKAANLPLNRYLALVLADAHNLEINVGASQTDQFQLGA